MRLSTRQLLSRLGAGESIAAVSAAAGISVGDFQAWWQTEIASRVPSLSGGQVSAVERPVRIQRDAAGIPHIFADSDADLFFGFGFATAQDRLFQLDYLRRRALGRLAEVLGPDGFELDLVARTVGLHLIAEQEWQALPDETRRLLTAFSDGINAAIAAAAEKLPIEFDLLDYRPEPWRPIDSLAIAGEFRWYLTGRFPVIVIPELAKRTLGTGPLYDAFLLPEADGEAILPTGSYPASRSGTQSVGVSINDPTEGSGSNNWVVSGKKSVAGKPLLASDPHIAFAAVSCWHQVRLHGGSFNAAGAAYVGVPGIVIGKNEHVAWGITNNICSIRDLYQERSDPEHPDCYLYDGRWEPVRTRTEVIAIKGREAVHKVIRSSRNGPIVDEILPASARSTGPVALRWLGASACGWVTAMLGMSRARSGEELRRATEPWLAPTFCVVHADTAGEIGYQCTGRIPVRNIWERGYRPGWDPAHQWAGLIPFAGMPRLVNPPRGWIATANNRVAADDFPYPLSGTWSSGYRAQRVREMLESREQFRRQDFARMHQDSVSLRAVTCVPRLLRVVTANADQSLSQADCVRICELAAAGERVAGRVDSMSEAVVAGPTENQIDRAAAPLSAAATPRPDRIVNATELTRWTRLAVEYLAAWDCRAEPDRVAASIFNLFFDHWCRRVAEERFAGESAMLVAGAIGGLASALLEENAGGWFRSDDARSSAIIEALHVALVRLAARFGPDPLNWGWGRLHTLEQKHVLSGRGDLGRLLDRGGVSVRGDAVTVCNTGQGLNYTAPIGAGYRMIADFSDPRGGFWAVDAGSQSGHPGSPHYDDQLTDWLTAGYRYLPLQLNDLPRTEDRTLTIRPRA
jgi:penicillin amidase